MTAEMPIFFIGMPRSGTTVIFEGFSSQEELGWLSNYSLRFPSIPYVALVHRFFDLFMHLVDKKPFFSKVVPKPREVYSVWEKFFGRRFSFTFLAGYTPSEVGVEKARKYIARFMWASGKARFCAKLTGPPRIRLLSHVFPDAYFINVVRDPRAVVASLLYVDFWRERGLTQPYWKDGLTRDEISFWSKQTSRSPVALAALLWRSVYETALKEIKEAGKRCLTVKYEDFTKSPLNTLNAVSDFCRLKGSRSMQEYVMSRQYFNMNYKARERLAGAEILMIEKILDAQIKALGYL